MSMINMNRKMKKILNKQGEQSPCSEVNIIVNDIVENTKIIRECILYDKENTLKEEKINFTRILRMVGDWTGYEVSCNEIRFSLEKVNASNCVELAEKLSCLLTLKYVKDVVIYITLYENMSELRFHTYRENEQLWLEKDLNKYNMPILCMVKKVR